MLIRKLALLVLSATFAFGCSSSSGGADAGNQSDDGGETSTDGGNVDAASSIRNYTAECDARCRTEAELKSVCSDTAPENCVDDCVANSAGLDTLCGKCVVADSYINGTSCDLVLGNILNCDQECLPGNHSPQTTYQAECEATCRTESLLKNVCSDVAPENCVQDCMTNAAGLDTLCGKCVVADTYINGTSCDLILGDVGNCRVFCL